MLNCFLTYKFTEHLCNVGSAYFYRSNGTENAGCLYYIIHYCIGHYVSIGVIRNKQEKYMFSISAYNAYTSKHGEYYRNNRNFVRAA